jgi:hypothetical protein
MRVRGDLLVFFLCGKTYPKLAHGFSTQKRGSGAKGARRSGGQRYEEAGHGGGGHKHCPARTAFRPCFGGVLTPGPIAIPYKALNKTAEESRRIEGIDGCAKNNGICGFNIGEDGFQIVLLQAFAAFFAVLLHAVATVGTEFDLAVAKLDGLRYRSACARPLEDSFDRLVDCASVAIATDDGHDFPAHFRLDVCGCRKLTTIWAGVL